MVMVFLPGRCLCALGGRDAQCQAPGATALPVKARALAGSTGSRGFASLAPSVPIPSHFHSFQTGWHHVPSPQSLLPPGPTLTRGAPCAHPTVHMMGSPLCQRKVGKEQLRDMTPVPVLPSMSPSSAARAAARAKDTAGRPPRRLQSSGSACMASPGHVPGAPQASSSAHPRPYPLLRLPRVHHEQRGLLTIYTQSALIDSLCKTPGEPSWCQWPRPAPH